MSEIELFLDQDNELRFQVAIEGSRPGIPKYRLNFEARDMSYSFNGLADTSGEIIFNVPAMKNMLKEGVYKSSLEVLIDGRYFAPLTSDAKFKQEMKVTAESVVRTGSKNLGVSAAIVARQQPEVVSAKPIVETAAQKTSKVVPVQAPVQVLKAAERASVKAQPEKKQDTKKITESKASNIKQVDEITRILRDLIRKQM